MSVQRETDEHGDTLELFGTLHLMRVFTADGPGGAHPLMVEIDGVDHATALLTQQHIDALHAYLSTYATPATERTT